MRKRIEIARTAVGILCAASVASCAGPPGRSGGREELPDGGFFPAALISPGRPGSLDRALEELKLAGYRSVVLPLAEAPEGTDPKGAGAQALRHAAEQIKEAGLGLVYWIEIGRCPELAREHPRWMASIQGPHAEWRRYFEGFPEPSKDEVVKVWPWVPVGNEEAFAAQLERVGSLLAALPKPGVVLLNDLQAAPSACGCGHILCRWTTDYGPIHTATPLGDDAAARFVDAVEKLSPGSEIIPVWTTECEEHDMAESGRCAGVHCFEGKCWYELSKQLNPVLAGMRRLGVLLPHKDFQREDALYGASGGWVRHAIRSLAEMPPKRNGTPVSAERLIAVLQGWDVTESEKQAQISAAREAGAGGYVVAFDKIEQSWEPRIVCVCSD